jgi:hypothetical protein
VLSTKGGDPKLVSTGKGRTTCAYFLKGDKEIVYASTHEAGPKCPTPPDMSKGYLWGLFEYDIYKANADGTNLRNLTPNTPGYDAEATVCAKDGSIVFTSTRSGDLELYRMDADGKNVRQLTNLPGYDGGAFFSADCSKIVWRSSRPQGKDLEEYKTLLEQKLVKPGKMDLYVANADGSDARQVTYLPGASFAPFFFPDGKRIIFSSNYQNPRGPEFDLFAVDIDGSHLEQITFSGGFDGFPVFSPDGKTLSFSSNRRDTVKGETGESYRMTGTPAGEKDTNVFLADWVELPREATRPSAVETAAAERFAAQVAYLADDAREGRGVGTKGLVDAATHVEEQLKAAGLEPGDHLAPGARGDDRAQAQRDDRARDRWQAAGARGVRAAGDLEEWHRDRRRRRGRLGHRRQGREARRLQGQVRRRQARARTSLRPPGREAETRCVAVGDSARRHSSRSSVARRR